MTRFKMISYIAIVLLSGVPFAVAGALIDDWPDAIICKQDGLNGSERRLVMVLATADKTDSCPNGAPREPRSTNAATYRSVHNHQFDGAGNPINIDNYFMSFCGFGSVGDAELVWGPTGYTDCIIAGLSISQLIARGQTRNFQ
jgi:hypothetical protein